jgi:molecular chaperone DnaK (HSP70)
MTEQAVMPVVHGIDFGTSTSIIMVGRPGVPALLIRDPTAAQSEVGIPTSVCARRDGTLAVGYEAERIKQIRIQDYRTGFKLEVGQPVSFRLGAADYSPDGLMAEVIRFLRERAMTEVPIEPDVVLVTVPVSWEEWRRDLTVRACVSAGYDPAQVRLETEPVAALASLGYVPGKTVVYDLGGGTFDCVLTLDPGGGPGIIGDPFGLPQIGGRAFDDRILHHVRQIFPQAAKIFASDADDVDLLRRRIQLREKCVRAKIQLSFSTSTEDLLSELDPPETLELDQAVLSRLIDDLVEQTVDECERMLGSLGLSWPEVDQCVLIGGSSRVPLIKQRMRDRSERPVRRLEEPELAVVRGATALALGLVTPPEPQSLGAQPPEPGPPEPETRPPQLNSGPAVQPGSPPAGPKAFDPARNLFEEG